MTLSRTLALSLLVVLLSAGCESPDNTVSHHSLMVLNNDVGRENLQKSTLAMTDSALMHNMSVADIHFVPHTAELNVLGVKRLDRYADLLAQHGGLLHVESANQDEQMNVAKMHNVMAYLNDAGIPADQISVEPGLSRGRGMSADEAILVIERMKTPEELTLTDLVTGSSGGAFGGG